MKLDVERYNYFFLFSVLHEFKDKSNRYERFIHRPHTWNTLDALILFTRGTVQPSILYVSLPS